MDTNDLNIVVHDIPPYMRVYKDGTVERILGTEITPATENDPETGVSSKDVVLSPDTGVSARLYRPNLAACHDRHKKLPLVVYFHGGAFCISSTADPVYHSVLNILVKEAQVILVSVDYRRPPENPLPTAYEDSWTALRWVGDHVTGLNGTEFWISELADFDRVFLAGDSAGANISHHMAIRAGLENPGFRISGILMIHPYFWGENPMGVEAENPLSKSVIDKWWIFVCPSDKGCDDPLINPFVDGAPSLVGLGCGKILVCVAGNDIFRQRGKCYYQALVKSDWVGKAEFYETDGEDHVFFLMDRTSENSNRLIKRCAEFINSV
ncbi:hypothetical protein OROGR_016497 [Orobanche gracilis]